MVDNPLYNLQGPPKDDPSVRSLSNRSVASAPVYASLASADGSNSVIVTPRLSVPGEGYARLARDVAANHTYEVPTDKAHGNSAELAYAVVGEAIAAGSQANEEAGGANITAMPESQAARLEPRASSVRRSY